jgi:two-component system sensor histidine kinase UhpB
VPLLHRVAAVNALLLLLVVVVTIVVLVPGHQSSYRLDEEGVVLTVALILVVLLNVYLLRRIVRPLQQLTELARTVDLTDPRPPVPDAEPNSEAGELAVTLNEMLERLRNERREATGRVLAGQEAERLRIAQELHDQVGQELTAVLLLLSRVEAQATGQLQPVVSEAQEAVRASLEDVRRIAVELRPEALDDLGLGSALAVLCNRLAERSGAEVSCRIADPLPALSPEIELVIYRVAQEALTNVARHSGGVPAELGVGANEAMVILTVRDRGRGFDPSRPPGSGIRGMRERAGLIGAKLEINSSPGNGVEVQLRVPLQSVA